MRIIRRALHEPLVHFLILGAVVCGIHRAVAPPVPTHRIVLSDAAIYGLRQEYVRRNGLPPTEQEEAALIQRYIDDEVLYREALAQGFERGDIIVRRRLIQKMEFALQEFEPLPEPPDTELQAYLEAHADRYAVPERVALTQVFVSTDRHPQDASQRAAALRGQLLAGADPATLGDPFLRGQQVPLQAAAQLASTFGTQFAAQVMTLPPGNWSEPLRSSYGLHLVRVTERAAAVRPTLASVRANVLRDWQEERRSQMDRAAIERLRQRYEIHIDRAREDRAWAQPAPVAVDGSDRHG